MTDKKIIIFDIKSDFGHFRKYNTTTSPLTYPIPSRTAAVGILGAILGIERELRKNKFKQGQTPLQELFNKQQAHIAIKLMNKVKTLNQGFNLINTKNTWYDLTARKNKEPRTQINFELLKDPYFRFFVSLEDEHYFKTLEEKLRNKQTHFTVSMGLAQFLADIEFIETSDAIFKENKNQEYVEIISAINMKYLYEDEPVKFDYQAFYSVNTMPLEMLGTREVTEYGEILIEKNAKTILAKPKFYYKVENHGNILFL